MGEWSNQYGSVATQKKLYIGKGVKYFERVGVGEFVLESHDVKVGDKLIVTGPTTGYVETTVEEIRLDSGASVDKASKGNTVAIRIPEKIRPSDKLYKVVSSNV